jgi:hypothetical protein
MFPKKLSFAFHAGNRGSNPLGDANLLNMVVSNLAAFFIVSRE